MTLARCSCGCVCPSCKTRHPFGGGPVLLKWQYYVNTTPNSSHTDHNYLVTNYPDIDVAWNDGPTLRYSETDCVWRIRSEDNSTLTVPSSMVISSSVADRVVWTYYGDSGPAGVPSGMLTRWKRGWWVQASGTWYRLNTVYDAGFTDWEAAWDTAGYRCEGLNGTSQAASLFFSSLFQIVSLWSSGPSYFWHTINVDLQDYNPDFFVNDIRFIVYDMWRAVAAESEGALITTTCNTCQQFWGRTQVFSETATAEDGSGLSLSRLLYPYHFGLGVHDADWQLAGIAINVAPSRKAFNWTNNNSTTTTRIDNAMVGYYEQRFNFANPFYPRGNGGLGVNALYPVVAATGNTTREFSMEVYPSRPKSKPFYGTDVQWASIPRANNLVPSWTGSGVAASTASPADWERVGTLEGPTLRDWEVLIQHTPFVCRYKGTVAISGQFRPCEIIITPSSAPDIDVGGPVIGGEE
jgi:hypothetical protein